jgi:ribosomal protein S18
MPSKKKTRSKARKAKKEGISRTQGRQTTTAICNHSARPEYCCRIGITPPQGCTQEDGVACRKFITELEERCSQMNISHPDRSTLWDVVKAACTMKDDHDNIFIDYRRKKTLKVYLSSTGARLVQTWFK